MVERHERGGDGGSEGGLGGGSERRTANITATSTVYSSVSGSTALMVSKQSQTITFGSLSNQTYGAAPFALNPSPSATSGLPVSVAGTSPAVCTTSGTYGLTVTIGGAGSCSLTASQAGNGDYNAAPDVTQSFTVNPAIASVTPNAASKTYGASRSELYRDAERIPGGGRGDGDLQPHGRRNRGGQPLHDQRHAEPGRRARATTPSPTAPRTSRLPRRLPR